MTRPPDPRYNGRGEPRWLAPPAWAHDIELGAKGDFHRPPRPKAER